VDELEGGLGVVVQPPHQARIELIPDAEAIEVTADGREVLGRRRGEMVDEQRRIGGQLPDLRALVVEDPQWIDFGARPRGLIEGEAGQVLGQQGPVCGPVGRSPQGRQLQPVPGQSQPAVALVGNRDHLGVECRIIDADGLDADLLKLPITPLLRLLVPEEGAGIAQLHRQLAAIQPMLEHGAHDPGGPLRAQRHTPLPPVGEGVHLLGHDIGGLAHSPGEQCRVLEHGQLDVSIARQRRRVGKSVPDPGEVSRSRRVVIRNAPRRLKFAHSPKRPFEVFVGSPEPPISTRNGLVARSVPIVVWGP